MIKLNNYFYDVSDIKIEEKEVGNERRGYDGTKHSNYIRKYLKIDITITELKPVEHYQLLSLVSTNRPYDSAAEHLVFNNLLDDEYLNGQDIIVDIVKEGYEYDRLEGEQERYEWTLTLEEV